MSVVYLLVFSNSVTEHRLKLTSPATRVSMPRMAGKQQSWTGRLEILNVDQASLIHESCVLPGETLAYPGWPLDLLANGGSAAPVPITHPTDSLLVRLHEAKRLRGELLVYLCVEKT